jgi:hypothetical protein
MRVVYDYGSGIPSGARGASRTDASSRLSREAALVVRLERPGPTEGGLRHDAPAGTEEGRRITIAGRDYVVAVSPEAARQDQAVRYHERSHALTLGAHAGSAVTYRTELGPDGRRYVTGGAVKADLSPVPGNPRATLQKARTVFSAAYAVGSPSAADMRVARDAYRLAQQAKRELREVARA